MNEDHSVLQITWLLFSDLSTRINVLSNECAHLQDTIFGLLELTSNETLGTHQRRKGSEERPWVKENLRSNLQDTTYYSLTNQERALVNLWNSVGSLAEGLDSHRSAAVGRFNMVAEGLLDNRTNHTTRSEDFYWFAAQRGHFLHDVFGFYTQQLQHAHQKLIQLLENMPGSLPNPLLLRRWHSAFYGEFLSEYSRHVNWQTQVLTWELHQGALSSIDQYARFNEWRSTTFLTHTWAHIPTSQARRHQLPSREGRDFPTRFGTIWSSFFYLEQPILFPLLYHESAHFQLDDPVLDACEDKSFSTVCFGLDGTASSSITRFFAAREEVASTLASDDSFETQDEGFWSQFADEIWADVISLTLGGTGYFAALLLQLFGKCGAMAFSRFDQKVDRLIDICDFGVRDREVREVPWPLWGKDQSYLWEARLLIAAAVTEKLHGPSDWLRAAQAAIDTYRESFSVTFGRAATSENHEIHAKFRIELNSWVVDVCMRCLDPHFSHLREHRALDEIYALDESVCGTIMETVRACEREITTSYPNLCRSALNEPALPSFSRLEDVAFLTRWHLSKVVALTLSSLDSATERRLFIDTQVNYRGNDGSSTFRLGLEWCMARRDLYDAAARALTDPAKAAAGAPDLWSRFNAAMLRDKLALKTTVINPTISTEEKLAASLRRKQNLTNAKYLPGSLGTAFPDTKVVLDDYLQQIAEYFRKAVPASSRARVGTLYLGVIRPSEIANGLTNVDTGKSQNGLYAQALRRARGYYYRAHRPLRTKAETAADHRIDFLPLVGEYSFAAYVYGSTPAEREFHPINIPKHFTKPRFVLEVFRGGRSKVEFLGKKRSLLSKSGNGLGRISLFRLRYRWQWVVVCGFLRDKEDELDPVLFLSSGWEDAILLTWHHDENHYWDTYQSILGLLDCDVDFQSNAVVMRLLTGSTTAQFPSPNENIIDPNSSVRRLFLQTLLAGRHLSNGRPVVQKINHRTGRYDYTILWNRAPLCFSGSAVCRLDDISAIMQALPKCFWRHIGRISTSYEESVDSVSIDGERCVGAERVLVSRVLVRVAP